MVAPCSASDTHEHTYDSHPDNPEIERCTECGEWLLPPSLYGAVLADNLVAWPWRPVKNGKLLLFRRRS